MFGEIGESVDDLNSGIENGVNWSGSNISCGSASLFV